MPFRALYNLICVIYETVTCVSIRQALPRQITADTQNVGVRPDRALCKAV